MSRSITFTGVSLKIIKMDYLPNLLSQPKYVKHPAGNLGKSAAQPILPSLQELKLRSITAVVYLREIEPRSPDSPSGHSNGSGGLGGRTVRQAGLTVPLLSPAGPTERL